VASGKVNGTETRRPCELSIAVDGTATLLAPTMDYSGNLGADQTTSARLNGDEADQIGPMAGSARLVRYFDMGASPLGTSGPNADIVVGFAGTTPTSAQARSPGFDSRNGAVCQF
jgi:hypothetical protein